MWGLYNASAIDLAIFVFGLNSFVLHRGTIELFISGKGAKFCTLFSWWLCANLIWLRHLRYSGVPH